MKKALIIYHSKTGTTKKFGFTIRDFLLSIEIEAKAIPIQNFVAEDLDNIEIIFLGCWTSGLFVMMQHPDKEWVEFAQKLPDLSGKKIGLFTTYKLLTGSMFSSMNIQLKPKLPKVQFTLKSRNSILTEKNMLKLKEFFLIN